MKNVPLFSFIVLAVTTVARAQAPSATYTSAADADWQAFQAVVKEVPPKPLQEMTPLERAQVTEQHFATVRVQALAFFEKHPADPRRWSAVMQLSPISPRFVQAWGTDGKGNPKPVIDEAAAAAWKARVAELQQALLASTDAPAEIREALEWQGFATDFRAAKVLNVDGQGSRLDTFRTRFDAHVAKFGSMDVVAARARDYLGALEKAFPGTSAEIWRHLLDAPNAALRQTADTQLGFLAMMSKPLEMAFTAVDGRQVDLKSLRGKVVLVDFWATWCGPCIAELPNVKKVYTAYHNRGFEVIGIALENAKLNPKDTPEQTAAKLEVARKVLTDFTASNEMPWPQHFDGKFWKNDLSTRYDITGIPAMFLLDQDGRVVTTNARGPALESEIKRLLKL